MMHLLSELYWAADRLASLDAVDRHASLE